MSRKMSLKGQNDLTISAQSLETACKPTESSHTQVGKTVTIVRKVIITEVSFSFLFFFFPIDPRSFRGHRQGAGVYPSCVWAKAGVHAWLNIDALPQRRHALFNMTDIIKKAHIK